MSNERPSAPLQPRLIKKQLRALGWTCPHVHYNLWRRPGEGDDPSAFLYHMNLAAREAGIIKEKSS